MSSVSFVVFFWWSKKQTKHKCQCFSKKQSVAFPPPKCIYSCSCLFYDTGTI